MRIRVRQVALACCALEVATALSGPFPVIDGIEWVEADPDLTVVLLAGTITLASRPKIEAVLAETTGPRVVMAYGVCASSGGPYWDAYSVLQGWPADVYVPGCPPRPEALWAAIREQVSYVG
jgi:NADH-quinone oxidoreductase subunit B